VLLPVWWSVRTGLKPLAQFAGGIAKRNPGDVEPLRLDVRHREIRPLAQALDALLAQLRERFERERVFVQDAAHEIRTPLAVIATQAHVLARADDAMERERAAGLLAQAIERASHLAQQLLLLATLDEPRAAARRHVDVAQVVRELLAQLAPHAMARAMDLSLEAPDHLWCEVDEAAFNSTVTNLVDNAIRYGREGGAIVVTLRGDAERLSVQVQDDGPGIAAEERERVFDRFYRAAGQDRPGSGLGLAIVRQAARRMGGHAVLGAGLGGQGAGFVVSLPVRGFRPG
jgi:two-component system sensor histidine kinase QseC